jgi:hypothetical protein
VQRSGAHTAEVAHPDAEAVLVTGVYGSGKTAAIEEMAEILEAAAVPYAAIDLDWLVWANVDDHGPASHRLLLENVRAVVENDRSAGMTRFLLAGTFEAPEEVAEMGAAIGMPIRVVRLSAPVEVIVARLARSPTAGRSDDLEQARRDLAERRGEDLGDLVVASDRPVREIAEEILEWLGWVPSIG